MTARTWKTAPIMVRALLVYWHLWPAFILVLFVYIWNSEPDGEALEFMLLLWQGDFQVTPLASSVGAVTNIVSFLCPVFAWRLLKGKKSARKILEVAARFFLINTSLDVFFPQIWYLEMDSVPAEATETEFNWILFGLVFVVIDALALLGMRSRQCRDYAIDP